MALRPNADHCLLILGFLDHTQRCTTFGRTALRPVATQSHRPLPNNTQHSQQTNIYASGGIRTHSLNRRTAADLRLRSRAQWDRPATILSALCWTTDWNMLVATDPLLCFESLSFNSYVQLLPNSATCLCSQSCILHK